MIQKRYSSIQDYRILYLPTVSLLDRSIKAIGSPFTEGVDSSSVSHAIVSMIYTYGDGWMRCILDQDHVYKEAKNNPKIFVLVQMATDSRKIDQQQNKLRKKLKTKSR